MIGLVEPTSPMVQPSWSMVRGPLEAGPPVLVALVPSACFLLLIYSESQHLSQRGGHLLYVTRSDSCSMIKGVLHTA